MASDGADATWRGRSLQTVAPETGNVRLFIYIVIIVTNQHFYWVLVPKF